MVEVKAFGKNWNGKFIILVDDRQLVGVDRFSISHRIDWAEIEDVSEYMPIGWARGGEGITWEISLKNIRGEEEQPPSEANILLAKKRMSRSQFKLTILEENAVEGKSDWMFNSITVFGCVAGGNTALVGATGGGATIPSLDYGGGALRAEVELADGSIYRIPAS